MQSKTAAHTPLPWAVKITGSDPGMSLQNGGGDKVYIIGPDYAQSGSIARVCRLGKGGQDEHARSTATIKANAALIAKAVNAHEDLLECLKHLVVGYERFCTIKGTECKDPWLTKATQAIAKAEGRTA